MSGNLKDKLNNYYEIEEKFNHATVKPIVKAKHGNILKIP